MPSISEQRKAALDALANKHTEYMDDDEFTIFDEALDTCLRSLYDLPVRPEESVPYNWLSINLNKEEKKDDDNSLRSEDDLEINQIDWTDFSVRVSKYFTVGEVFQYDERRFTQDKQIKRNILTLAKQLDNVREAWGAPIFVTSWYRDYKTNKRVGGVFNSQHLTGKAVDITVASNKIEFEHWLDTEIWYHKALGYGQGSGRGFTHLDLRINPNGKGIRWYY